MESELKQLFQPVRYNDVILVEEGYRFTEETNFGSDTDLSSEEKCQGDGILDLLKKQRIKLTTIAESREPVMADSKSEMQTKIVIGIGKPEKYLLDSRKSASMLNEILNLLDNNYQLKTEELKSFVKKYGYLHQPSQSLIHNNTKSDIVEQVVRKGYDSLDTWQHFVLDITETIRIWENPLCDIYNPYTGENDYSGKYRDLMIQLNEFYLERNYINLKSDSDNPQNIDKRKLSNKIFLAQKLGEGIANGYFKESFYVLPDSGQILPYWTPRNLYSFIWLWIKQTILDEKAPQSLHKCIFCNKYAQAMDLRRSQKRNPITREHYWQHEKCYRRDMKRKKIEEKAKSEGRPLHIRPKARKNGV